jgi:hypothetical protein
MQSMHLQSLINSLVSTHLIPSHLCLNWGMVSFASHNNTLQTKECTMSPMKRYAKKQAKATKRRRGSGSRAGLLLPSPLRTARTTFTVSRSSLSNALLRNAVMPRGRPSQYALGASAPSGVPHTNQWWCARHLRVWRVHQWVDPLSSAFSPKEVGQALL